MTPFPTSKSLEPIFAESLQRLHTILPQECLDFSENARVLATRDETPLTGEMPIAVVTPKTIAQIQAVVLWANEASIPIFTRGAGTGLSGGALPSSHGIVLSTNKLNQILKIDTENLTANVQAGVVTQALHTAVEELGLFYPPDPASKGSSTIGGNWAHSSGGPRAMKYGGTKDYILDLDVVTGKGDIIKTGAETLKNSTGYNLTQLMIGSEGTLGVIASGTVKLLAFPRVRMLVSAWFEQVSQAAECVVALRKMSALPSAIELVTRKAYEFSAIHLGLEAQANAIQERAAAWLLVEIDGFDEAHCQMAVEHASEIMMAYTEEDLLLYATADEQSRAWRIRRNIAHAIKAQSEYLEEDVCVPPAAMPTMLAFAESWAKKHHIQLIAYGHAGDGNIHLNLLRAGMSESQWEAIPDAVDDLFAEVKRLGGVLSGEHGVGWLQARYLPIFKSQEEIALMRGIKQVFDPNNILNPGKIWPH